MVKEIFYEHQHREWGLIYRRICRLKLALLQSSGTAEKGGTNIASHGWKQVHDMYIENTTEQKLVMSDLFWASAEGMDTYFRP